MKLNGNVSFGGNVVFTLKAKEEIETKLCLLEQEVVKKACDRFEKRTRKSDTQLVISSMGRDDFNQKSLVFYFDNVLKNNSNLPNKVFGTCYVGKSSHMLFGEFKRSLNIGKRELRRAKRKIEKNLTKTHQPSYENGNLKSFNKEFLKRSIKVKEFIESRVKKEGIK